MTINLVELFALIKELISNSEKMQKFREITSDIKELIDDIKEVVRLIKG